jgi:hypothetical protein
VKQGLVDVDIMGYSSIQPSSTNPKILFATVNPSNTAFHPGYQTTKDYLFTLKYIQNLP